MKTIHLALISMIFLVLACNGNQVPTDVTLNPITQDANGIQISWSTNSDGNFNSYKLYRHTSSGIDASTGDLVHVETSSSTTSFTDLNFNPLVTYYYRIYVLTDDGQSNGSNIVSITTQSISLVDNGSFENGSSVPNNWSLTDNSIGDPLNSIVIDNTTSSDGSQSLKFHHNSSTGCWEQWIDQNLTLSDLDAGGTYEFSIDYKMDTPMTSQSGMGAKITNGQLDIQMSWPSFAADGNWHSYATQFVLPANLGSTNPQFRLHFCTQGIMDWWIDNVQIVKV